MKKLLYVATAVIGLVSIPAHADKVIGISDGDTLTVLKGKKPVRLRLADIDAPEKDQAFGERSRQSLAELCLDKDATYTTETKDQYGRPLARVICGGMDVNRVQVDKGMAWVHPRHNKDEALPALQKRAKAEKRGLWADPSPVPPWKFRRTAKARQP